MSIGLPNGITTSNPAWPLYFSNFMAQSEGTGGAWEHSMGEDIAILHPDTGYTEHPELMRGGRYIIAPEVAMNLLRSERQSGKSARDPLTDPWHVPLQFPGHGTTVASTMIGGFNRNTAKPLPSYSELSHDYASGSAPLSYVLPQRVARSVAQVDPQSIAALVGAVYWAVYINSRPDIDFTVGVVNISLGIVLPLRATRRALDQALLEAQRRGVIVCAAAGQAGQGSAGPNKRSSRRISPPYPGSSDYTICVAACGAFDEDGVMPEHVMLDTGFYGGAVDITAPGVGVAVAKAETGDDGGYRYIYDRTSGSSHATAMVSAACALWQAKHGRHYLLQRYTPPLMLAAFKEVLRRSCYKPIGWDTENHGNGILDVNALLLESLPSQGEVLDIVLDEGA